MYNVLELTGLPGCSFVSVETPNSDSPKARPAAVTKFADAQSFDGFVCQKALYAIDLSIVIVWLIVSGVPREIARE